MNRLFEAAEEICTFMAAQNWRFCIIGELAVQQWGESRTTLDAENIVVRQWDETGRKLTKIRREAPCAD